MDPKLTEALEENLQRRARRLLMAAEWLENAEGPVGVYILPSEFDTFVAAIDAFLAQEQPRLERLRAVIAKAKGREEAAQ